MTRARSTERAAGRAVVFGIGNEWRNDDGVGLVVVERLRQLVTPSEAARVELGVAQDPLDMLRSLEGAQLAVIVDATVSGGVPGAISVLDIATRANPGAVPLARGTTSTHAVGIARAIRLARALELAPVRTVIVGVEGASFDYGNELSPAVAGAVDEAARVVSSLIRCRRREEDPQCA